MKRPLLVSAIAFIWGIVLADGTISLIWGIISVLISSILIFLLYRPKKAELSHFVLLAIPFLILGFTFHFFHILHHQTILKSWEGKTVSVSGSVADEPVFKDGKIRFTLDIRAINNYRVERDLKNAMVRVTLYTDADVTKLNYGSVIQVSGEIKIPQSKRNLGGFDHQKYLAAKEISGTMAVPLHSLTVLEGKEALWLKDTGYKIRKSILEVLDQCLPTKESSVLAGMLIGYTDDMPEEMEENFRIAGLSHILAVSGANIAFLILPLLLVLKHIGFNRRWSSALTFPVMLFYVFATGMEASVVRAAIMAGVTLIGMYFWRKTDIYCSMAASAILILIRNSYMLYDMGFILSFSATLSLAVLCKPISNKLPVKIPKSIRETLAATLSAQLGVIPVIAYCFNSFSVVSVFSNLLIVPMTGLITILGAITAVLGNLILPLGKLFGSFAKILIDLMLLIIEYISKISWAELGIATPPLIFIVLYYLILLYFRYWHPKLPINIARPVLAGILALCGSILVMMCIPGKSLKIYFTDVGQGDCILVRTPQNKQVIIDGGGSINDEKGSYTGENIVVPLLYDFNMTEIDLMIATHGHADHINGLKSVLDKIEVKELAIADAPDLEMKELIECAQKKGIPVTRVREGAVLLQENGLVLQALYPLEESWLMPPSSTTGANEYSLVTRLDYGGFSALFTGDIGSETEKKILDDGAALQCDLLKVAHHGSKYSSGKGFLTSAQPKLSVISVGQNRYGHPGTETINRLNEQKIQVLQTLEKGGVLVEVNKNDNSMKVTTVR